MTIHSDTTQAPEFYGYSVAYFDTNVYLALSRKPESWRAIRNFMLEDNLLLAVSDANVLELSDKLWSHRDVARFLLQVPSALLKPTTQIMKDEAQAYLDDTEVDPFVGPLTTLILESRDPIGVLQNSLFRREVVTRTRSQMVKQKPAFEKRIHDTMRNFGPTTSSRQYTENDGPYYALQLICSQILSDCPGCAEKVQEYLAKSEHSEPHLPSHFRGMWLFALAQFYRYYLHRRIPEGNDYGDFLQVVPIPYSRISVVETKLRDDLRHIKKQDPSNSRFGLQLEV
jgi:hypothetical protein